MTDLPGWLTLSHCLNCGKYGLLSQYAQVYTAPYLNVEFCHGILPVVTMSNYVQCGHCGLVMQSPRMTDERIAEYYASGMYRKTLGLSVESMDADEKRRSLDVAKWLVENNVRPRKHLDIGCSRGYLLEYVGAKQQTGYDQNEGYAESVDVVANKSQLKTYDLLTAIHVLEHVSDPLAELRWYKSLCTDKLLIEVPSEHSKGGPMRFAHLSYFPIDTLIQMVESAGMRVLELVREPHTRILCEVK